MTDEGSGSHPASPPHISVPSGREGGEIVLNVKTIMFILALLAGGGIGGGGISLVTKGADGATKEAVEKLDEKITVMTTAQTNMNTTLVQMRGEMQNDSEARKRTDEELQDHEQRIRVIERKLR